MKIRLAQKFWNLVNRFSGLNQLEICRLLWASKLKLCLLLLIQSHQTRQKKKNPKLFLDIWVWILKKSHMLLKVLIFEIKCLFSYNSALFVFIQFQQYFSKVVKSTFRGLDVQSNCQLYFLTKTVFSKHNGWNQWPLFGAYFLIWFIYNYFNKCVNVLVALLS